MESQPQNPEFRNNPENFHPSMIRHSHKTVNEQFFFISQPAHILCGYSNELFF